MKTFLFISALCLQYSLWAQIPNGSFENWTSLEAFTHPESDYTFTSTNNGVFYVTGTLGALEVDGAEGSAVRIQTSLIGQDTLISFGLFGEAPQGSDLVFSSGIPFPLAIPDTARMQLRYDINPDVEGSVFFQFYQSGELVTMGSEEDSLFIHPVSGFQDEWETLAVDLTQLEFNTVPDECVIGFSSNNIFDAVGTPGDFLEIDNLELLSALDTILVSDFDSWVLEESPLQLDEWNSFFNPASGYVFRSEDSFIGSASLGLLSQAADTNVIQSSVFLGELSDFGINPDQPLPENAFMLKFRYKYISQAPDSGRVNILLSGDNDPETLDVMVQSKVLTETDEWTEMSIELGSAADSAFYFGLEFHSGPISPGEPSDSSLLLVDGVELLTLQECGFEPQLTELDSIYCPDQEVLFSSLGLESYSWFIQQPNSTEFSVFSNEESAAVTFNTSGSYNYFLVGENEDCFQSTDTLSFNVIELNEPVLTAEGFETISMCANSELSLAVSNSAEFSSLTWFLDNELISSAQDGSLIVQGQEGFSGVYTVEANPAQCPLQVINSNEVIVSTYPLSEPSINQNGTTLSTQSFSSYQWYLDGEVIPGGISQFYNPLEDGNYAVEVNDQFGCVFLSQSFAYSAVGIHEPSTEHIKVYPNPASDFIVIECVGGCGAFRLVNAYGQVVWSTNNSGSGALRIDISELSSGIYYFNNGLIGSKIILKE